MSPVLRGLFSLNSFGVPVDPSPVGPGTCVAPGCPGNGLAPDFPGTSLAPCCPANGLALGFPGTSLAPGCPSEILLVPDFSSHSMNTMSMKANYKYVYLWTSRCKCKVKQNLVDNWAQ